MAQFDNLPKITYNNSDGSDKTTQTLPDKVGAWDMEQIAAKINEMATFNKQGYLISTSNPSKQYVVQNNNWVESVGGTDPKSQNTVGTVKFNNIFGNWVNGPSAPIITAIAMDFTAAVNGGTAAVYYKAAVLNISDSSSRIIMRSDSTFISDELCVVWFIYDAGTGGVHVSVQAGDTGNRPSSPGNQKPVITRIGSSSINVEVDTSYTDAGATAYDAEDGNITSSIVTINPVIIGTIGTYTVTYNVSDSLSLDATEVTRTVNVVSGAGDITIPATVTILSITD